MVDSETRNNLIVIIILVAVAALVTIFVTNFNNSIVRVADEFNNDMDKIVAANSLVTQQRGQQYLNLSKAIDAFDLHIENNTYVLFHALNRTNFLLATLLNGTGHKIDSLPPTMHVTPPGNDSVHKRIASGAINKTR